MSPRIGEGVYVSPTATVIGDVELGSGSSVWCGAVVLEGREFILPERDR